MANLDIIKSYLVDVGFNIDDSGLGTIDNTVQQFAHHMQSPLGLVTKMFQDLGTSILTVSATIGASLGGLLDGLGNQEIQMEILSRQYWTSTQNAMAFSEALKVLHTNVQDLYLSPTLLAQYQQLYSLGKKLQTPGNYAQTIKGVQNIQLQFRELQVDAYYALQWIGYYFTRYMSGPLSNLQSVLQNLNTTIQKNMPAWTANVAKFLVGFVQFWQTAWQVVSGVGGFFVNLVNSMPGWAKVIAAAIGIISLAMNATPFGKFIEAFTAIVLLFQDYETWQKHGKSAFGGLWATLSKIQPVLKVVVPLVESLAVAWAVGKVVAWVQALNLAKFAVLAFETAVNVVKKAFLALDIVVETDPIVLIISLIIAAVAALAFGIYELIKHWAQVKQAGIDAWNAIKLNLLQLKDVFSNVWKAIVYGAQSAWTDIVNAFKISLNWIISGINNLIKLIDMIPGVKVPLIAKIGLSKSPSTPQYVKMPKSPTMVSILESGAKQSSPKIPIAGTRAAAIANGHYSAQKAANSRSHTNNVTVNHNTYNIDGKQSVTVTSTSSADSVAKAINNAHTNHVRMIGAVVQ